MFWQRRRDGGVDLWKSFHRLSLWQRVNRRRPADVPNETTEAQMRGMGAALSGIRTRVSLLPPAGASDHGLVCQAPRKEQWWARGYAPHAPHPGGHVLKHRWNCFSSKITLRHCPSCVTRRYRKGGGLECACVPALSEEPPLSGLAGLSSSRGKAPAKGELVPSPRDGVGSQQRVALSWVLVDEGILPLGFGGEASGETSG